MNNQEKFNELFVEFKGRYSKFFGGAEYEEMFEVKPEEVTVTQYNRV